MPVPPWEEDKTGGGGGEKDKELEEGKLGPLGFHSQAVY